MPFGGTHSGEWYSLTKLSCAWNLLRDTHIVPGLVSLDKNPATLQISMKRLFQRLIFLVNDMFGTSARIMTYFPTVYNALYNLCVALKCTILLRASLSSQSFCMIFIPMSDSISIVPLMYPIESKESPNNDTSRQPKHLLVAIHSDPLRILITATQ